MHPSPGPGVLRGVPGEVRAHSEVQGGAGPGLQHGAGAGVQGKKSVCHVPYCLHCKILIYYLLFTKFRETNPTLSLTL